MSLDDYLTSCRAGDVAAVRARHELFVGKRESRPGHFLGFSGIHYAAYFGRVDVFELLLPYEIGLRTVDVIYVVDQFDQILQEIAPRTNVFALAIMAGRVEILRALETHFQQNAGLFWGKWSDRKRAKDALRASSSSTKQYVRQNLMPLLEALGKGTGREGLLGDFS